jgi:signal transduction histidine kinase/CheY-like chemotaxis protein
VACIPKSVMQHEVVVHIEIVGSEIDVQIPIKEIFPSLRDDGCLFYPGVAVCHEPYDIVRTGRVFYATVIGVDPLRLSRTKRIEDLWHELKISADAHNHVIALVGGQNKDTFFLCIEGNIFFRSSKAALEEYLKPTLNTPSLWHRYAPIEGDSLLGKVLHASPDKVDIGLDLVEPLKQLSSSSSYPYLMLNDAARREVNQRRHTFATRSEETVGPVRWLGLNHSVEIDKQRHASHVIIIEDDPCFGNALAQLLNEIGYQSRYESDVDRALLLATEESRNVFFLVDTVMKPKDGLRVISQLAERSKAAAKCVLMSELNLDDSLDSRGQISLREALAHMGYSFAFWQKNTDDFWGSLGQLDEIFLNYENYKNSFASTRTEKRTASVVPREASVFTPPEFLDELAELLEKTKRNTGAEWASLFEMDQGQWHVNVLAGDEFLKDKSTLLGAQTFLPNSPVRDISYQEDPILFDCDVRNSIPRFRNLLRFFGTSSLDADIDRPGFQSVAGIRLNIKTSKRYSLFLFHSQPLKFNRDRVFSVLEPTARKFELIILKRLNISRNRQNQPFYLEGLSHAGLRHDARSQISSIEMFADLALESINKADSKKAIDSIEGIRISANEAYQRITASLQTYLFETRFDEVDVEKIVERAISIAEGVGNARKRKESSCKQTIGFEVSKAGTSRYTLLGDGNALQRILENLLVNAVEHGLAFGRNNLNIVVELKRVIDSKYPQMILVHDNGPGIRGIDKAHVFEPLFSTKPDGYGMGLAVSRQIAQDYGMNVCIWETILLAGSTFCIQLPAQMRQQGGGSKI